MKSYDVIIIGGGPGGYSAAVRCRRHGLNTALIEKEHMGGTCLNWGCIPTKALLRNAEVIHLLSKGRNFGFTFDNLEIDYASAHKRSRSIVSRQTKRVEFLMKNNNVAVHSGTASLIDKNRVQIQPSGEILYGAHIILAVGAIPRSIPGVPDHGKRIITHKEALNLTQVPQSAVIIGAGPIGMEFATIWNRYGTRVTVVEMQPNVLPFEDEDISAEAAKQFKRNRIQIRCNTVVENISESTDGVDLTVTCGDQTDHLQAETVLVSIGVRPHIEGLDLETAGVKTEKGRILIDDDMRTSQSNMFAVGDVTGKMLLAHVASTQGVTAADAIVGKSSPELIYANIPRCTYAQPETASVGLTERQAREAGIEIVTAQCPFVANGKAVAADDNSGFVKVVAAAQDKTILGVHIIGNHVTELIAGSTGMMLMNANAEDLGNTIHPHPTMSEALMEAAQALCGQAIHI